MRKSWRPKQKYAGEAKKKDGKKEESRESCSEYLLQQPFLLAEYSSLFSFFFVSPGLTTLFAPQNLNA